MCEPDANSLPLEWTEYREHGTEFIKASTSPKSIAKQLQKVLDLPEDKKRAIEKAARQWVLNNFSIDVIGKKIEEFIDNAPFAKEEYFVESERNPYAKIDNKLENSQWIKSLYAEILKRPEVDENDDGHKYWMNQFSKGATRQAIENHFRNVALQENSKIKQISLEDFLDKDDKGKRIIFVIPESIGDIYMSTSLFESIKELDLKGKNTSTESY